MKKSLFVFLAVALALGIVSCNKNENNVTPVNNNEPGTQTEPTYQEGVYAPLMKISTITHEDDVSQSWNWNGDVLSSITSTDGENRQFTYSNGRISEVTGTMQGVPGRVSFTYDGNLFSRCRVSHNNNDLILLKVNHADGKISSADAAVDAEYIANMLEALIPDFDRKNNPIEPKHITLDENDNSIRVEFMWDDKNVAQLLVSGLIPFDLSKEMYESIKPYLPIDQSLLALIDIYFRVSNSIPLQININDTITYTYDTKFNPFYCYYGEVDPTVFSLNNVLTSIEHGRATISATLTQNPMQIMSQPIENYMEFNYIYNDRNYPTKVSGSGDYTITYKQ